MAQEGYLYVSPPTDGNNSAWLSALLSLSETFIQNALDDLSGPGVATRVINTYSAGLAGELVENALEVTFEIQSNPDFVKISGDDFEDVIIEITATGAAAALFGSLLGPTVLGLTLGAAIGVGIDVFYDTFIDASVDQITDFLQDDAQYSVQLKDASGVVLAGGFFAENFTEQEQITLAIQEFIEYGILFPEYPSVVPGMKIQFKEIIAEPFGLITEYTVYDGNIINEIADRFNKNSDPTDASSDRLFFHPSEFGDLPFTVYWKDTLDPLVPVQNRFIDAYLDATSQRVLLANPLIVAKETDRLVVDLDGSVNTPQVEFSPADFVSGTGVITASLDNNIITSDDEDAYISGLSGQDFIISGLGSDVITGGQDADAIYAGGGDDFLYAAIHATEGLEGDLYNGENGRDTVSYKLLTDGGISAGLEIELDYAVNFETGILEGKAQLIGAPGTSVADTLIGIENVVGSQYADSISGDAQKNILDGADGMDEISGDDGDDLLVGGLGNDTLNGGTVSNDVNHDLEDGLDTAFYKKETGREYVSVSYIVDGSGQPLYKTVTSEDSSVDTLYSIEAVFANELDSRNSFYFEGLSESPLHISSLTAEELAQLNSYYQTIFTDNLAVAGYLPPEINTAFKLENGDVFLNFSKVVGTELADSIYVDDVIGLTFDGQGDVDDVSYSGLVGGIKVTVDNEGTAEVERNSPVNIASVGSLEGLDFPKDTLENIERIFGSRGDDRFVITGATDKAIYADPDLVPSVFGPGFMGNIDLFQPSGNPYGFPFYTNLAYDVLDLSQLAENVVVQRGGAIQEGFVLSLSRSTVTQVYFEDGTSFEARGIEEIKLGAGDDLLIAGRTSYGVTVNQTMQAGDVYGVVDLGAGDDTVQLWGDAILKDGKIYTEDGTIISGFEHIELSPYNLSSVVGDYETIHTYELGYNYTKPEALGSASTFWIDYSSITSGMTFNLNGNGTGALTTGSGGEDTYTDPVGIIGTNEGDIFNIDGEYGKVYLGTGDDTVYKGENADFVGIYYSGGDDIFYTEGTGSPVYIDASVALSSINISFVNLTVLETSYDEIKYIGDIQIDISGLGSMTFVDGRTWYLNRGADDEFGTEDDYVTHASVKVRLYLEGVGEIELREMGGPAETDTQNVIDVLRRDFSDPDITGTSGDDTIIAESFEDIIVQAGSGHDQVFAGFGNDTLYGGDGGDYLRGEAGNDVIYGGSGNDILSGDYGDDIIDGGTGDDVLIGGSGKDIFIVDGFDTVNDYRVEEGDFIEASGLNGNNLSSYVTNGLVVLTDGTNSFRFMDLYKQLQSGNNVTKNVMIELSTGSKVVQFDEEGDIVDTRDGATSGNDTLAGTVGDDMVFGFDGADTLSGLAGNDTLIGGDGNDMLDGGDGDNTLDGGSGNDIYIHTAGFGTIRDAAGTDMIEFGAGYDQMDISLERLNNDHLLISFEDEPDVLIESFFITGQGVETLAFDDSSTFDLSVYHDIFGTSGNDTLNGLDNALLPDDRIFGYAGDDTLSGGLGDDYLEGGAGSDTYHYTTGLDTVRDSEGVADKISFASGFDAEDISFVRDGTNDMVIRFNGVDAVRVERQFTQAGTIETLEFADASTIDMSEVTIMTEGSAGNDTLYGVSYGAGANHLTGGDGNDSLYGTQLDDTLEGGMGEDSLYGGAGDDLYIISDAEDVVSDDSGTDVIKFGSAFDPEEISFERSGENDLVILFNSVPALTIQNQFSENSKIETLVFDDLSSIDLTTISHTLNGTSGDDTLYGVTAGGAADDVINGLDGSDTIHAYAGNNTLSGGGGDDTIFAGSGDDTYIYTSGLDTYEDAGGSDTVVFGPGYDQEDMDLVKDGDDLKIFFNSTHVITLQNHFVTGQAFETLLFNDASTFDLSTFINEVTGTSGDDALYGTAGSDILTGLAGNDTLYGYEDIDTLNGGTGDDTLYGGNGDDTYVFGDDFSATAAGDVVMELFGEGNDTIAFTDGILPTEIYSWTDTGGYLWYQLGTNPATNTLKIKGVYSASGVNIGDYVEEVVFDDETTWDLTEGLHLRNNSIGRTLYGTSYADTFEGGTANDVLRGFGGDDVYMFAHDFSANSTTGDRVQEAASEGTDTIRFIDSIAPGEVYTWTDTSGYLWFQLSTNPATNTLKADGTYSSTTGVQTYVEQVVFDDATMWDLTQGLYLYDTNDNRTLYGSALADEIHGNGGTDNIRAYGGNDVIYGGAGNDSLYGGAGDDLYVLGEDFSATTAGELVNENSYGGAGTDTIWLTDGVVKADFYSWTDSGGYLWLQRNTDAATNTLKIYGTYSSSLGVDPGSYIEYITFDDETSWDLTQGLYLYDTDDNRTMYGSALADEIHGNGGTDNIRAYGGNDLIYGDSGNDSLYGGAGDDLYVFGTDFSASTVGDLVNENSYGGAGTDTIWLTDSVTKDDFYTWTDGNGYLWLQHRTDSANNTLKVYGTYSSSTGVNPGSYIEYITFDDETSWDLTQGLYLYDTDDSRTIYGSELADEIHGNGGTDNIRAYGGNDVIYGGAGNDSLYGGAGDDLYVLGEDFSATTAGELINENSYGGAGTDTIWLTDGVMAEDFYLWTDSSGYLWLQRDTDVATNTLKIYGTYSSSTGVDVGSFLEYITFDDEITWDLTQGLHLRNNDTARTLYGSAQNDIIEGGAANDTLRGFSGDDELIGHNGTDALWGYGGADTFTFLAEDVGNGVDTLRDFNMTEDDVIDISDILTGYDPMVDALADFVQFTNASSHANLSVDIDGAGTMYGWTQIATVYNHNDLDPATMVANANLLVA